MFGTTLYSGPKPSEDATNPGEPQSGLQAALVRLAKARKGSTPATDEVQSRFKAGGTAT